MTTYTLNQMTGVIVNGDDGSIVQQDDSTLAYQNYAAWLAAGNSPTIVNVPANSGLPDPQTGYPDIGLTKLQFVERFTDQEYGAILQMSQQSVPLQVYLNKLNLTTPDSNGWSVYLSDPRTIAGVESICFALEQFGIIEAGHAMIRAREILSPVEVPDPTV